LGAVSCTGSYFFAEGREMNEVTEAQTQALGEYSRRGFTLDNDGSIALFLLHEGKPVARFSQVGATPQSLQNECANHLVTKHGWDGCLWRKGEENYVAR